MGIRIWTGKRHRNQLIDLVEAHNTIVEKKARRFRDFYQQSLKKKEDQNVFLSITQPDEQIKYIFEMVAQFFVHHYNDFENITCMKLNDKEKLEFCFYRNEPYSINNTFKKGEGCAGLAWKDKTIIIIPDRKKDQKYINKGRNVSNDNGSIISYPVMAGNELIYVINITTSKENIFKEKYKNHYIKIFDSFAKRIKLEDILNRIKKGVENETRQR